MKQRGFTIVELLIVIVVIGILAAITIVAYSGIQDRARQTKITSDLQTINKAIIAARTNENKVLKDITNCTHTGGAVTASTGSTFCGTGSASCYASANGTDLTTVTACYATYNIALSKISDASGINIRGLFDPWGRPYYIDENENESSPTYCTKDKLAVYANPHVTNSQAALQNVLLVANSAPACV